MSILIDSLFIIDYTPPDDISIFLRTFDLEKKKTFSVTDVYVLMAVFIWGTDFFFAKIALREISPICFSAIRTMISTAILLPFFIHREKDRWVPIRHLFWLAGLALLGTFLNRILWAIGLTMTTASNSSLIMATSPIFVLIASSLFLRNEVTLRAAIGILISFLGVFLVIRGDWKGWEIGSDAFLGNLITIGAALSWALFTVFAKRLLREYSNLKVTAYVMLISTILYLPFLPNDKAGGWWEISGVAWLSVLYVGIMGNCLGYFLWIVGIKNIGPVRTVLYSYLMPVTAIFLAIPFLEETVTTMQICGASVVLGGILLARSK
jgi:drug/metabolite transporter (DMT)-like permease